MKASAPFSTSQPLSCRTHGGRPSSMSMSAGARTATSVGTSSKRPWFGDLLGRLSSTMDGASRALKDAPQRFLDALVDATFRFTDQALNSAESNFAPVDETGEAIEIHQSQIQGAIPDGFPEGVYIRNGSNPLFGALHSTSSVLGQSREIWVEGEGMLHAVYFTKSSAGHLWSVSYASRYVQSETLELETARHKPCFLPAVEGDSAAIVAAYVFNYLRFGKVSKDISNTNVFEHSGRVFAVAENSLPYEICVGSLDTRDAWDVGGEWDRPFTAHPKVAPGSGELVIFGTDAKKPFLVVGVVSADGTKLKHRADLKLDRCTLCHDIGVTPKHNVIMDIPLTMDVGRIVKGGQLIQFEKESYARIGVMPRYGDADSAVWFDVEPFCMFHLVNCFEEGDEVVVQALRSPDSIIPGSTIALDKLDSEMPEVAGDDKPAKRPTAEEFFFRLYQWRLNLRTRSVSGEYLSGTDYSLEFPIISSQYTGLQHRYAYAQVVDSCGNCGKVNPKYGGFAKFYLDERSNAEVHIVDAKRFEDAPVAKITFPRRVPYGFHGTFVSKKMNDVM
ncbi:Carotenoid cleavage dioxygenase [Zea mays]|uniref:Carotenoid cleavage dioxygenase n=1 Tax=Zea mays TaxID=4577 RepID=A0A1D6I1X3_MAIZE|nr:Carotenoid cleavage dioxygenase [Zea mays]